MSRIASGRPIVFCVLARGPRHTLAAEWLAGGHVPVYARYRGRTKDFLSRHGLPGRGDEGRLGVAGTARAWVGKRVEQGVGARARGELLEPTASHEQGRLAVIAMGTAEDGNGGNRTGKTNMSRAWARYSRCYSSHGSQKLGRSW